MTRSSVPPPVTLVLDAADAWLPARLAAVERRLSDQVSENGSLLAAEARATLEAGGKRLRPMLVLLCAGPGAGEQAIRAAVAVELVHMATLVHDDVLDSAPLRRGRPTVYATAGAPRAMPLILARERDPSLAELDLRSLDAAGADAACERIAATGALEEVRAAARERIEAAKSALGGAPLEPEQRRLLSLVADGVVQRYS